MVGIFKEKNRAGGKTLLYNLWKINKINKDCGKFFFINNDFEMINHMSHCYNVFGYFYSFVTVTSVMSR